MLDLLKVLKEWGIDPIVRAVGWFHIGMFGLSLIPSLSFIPKGYILYVLTH